MQSSLSWGRFPAMDSSFHNRSIYWLKDLQASDHKLLAYGLGRSYGDSCLPISKGLLLKNCLDKFLAFDEHNGILRCQSGVTLEDILINFVPRGWFLPVSPGTKFVTVAGAIANDIHGKNHHAAGTFGRFVKNLKLWRSDGQVHHCSLDQNKELFCATVAGLGLTGFITEVELQLIPIKNSFFTVENIQFNSLDEFIDINQSSENAFDYTVAWIDALSEPLRGIYMRGNHCQEDTNLKIHHDGKLMVPIDFPDFALNKWSMKIFNQLYFHKQFNKIQKKRTHYDPFFYPLDAIHKWNRIYGKRGFMQYQCVLPFENGKNALNEIFKLTRAYGSASFLSVLKTFGELPSPGMLSFPKPGYTLCLDFPVLGNKVFKLFEEFDKLVLGSGGRLYPAKDARMKACDFKIFFPNWQDFVRHKDPGFNSQFWERVML